MFGAENELLLRGLAGAAAGGVRGAGRGERGAGGAPKGNLSTAEQEFMAEKRICFSKHV